MTPKGSSRIVLGTFRIIEHAAEPIFTEIVDKGEISHSQNRIFLVLRTAFLSSSTGGLALTLSTVTAGTAVQNPSTDFMMDTVVTIESGDPPSVYFNLPADGGTVFADVPSNLGHLNPFLKFRLYRQSVVIGKLFLACRYLQSEDRTGTTIPEDGTKRSHEVATATPWLSSLLILNTTVYVALNFSINRKIFVQLIKAFIATALLFKLLL